MLQSLMSLICVACPCAAMDLSVVTAAYVRKKGATRSLDYKDYLSYHQRWILSVVNNPLSHPFLCPLVVSLQLCVIHDTLPRATCEEVTLLCAMISLPQLHQYSTFQSSLFSLDIPIRTMCYIL